MSDLQPSKLGSKEYWDNIYEEELSNFDDFGDEGEVWFGQDSVEKMVAWAAAHVPPSGAPGTAPSIVEIGAGNGNLLFALADAGYAPCRLAGVDYSADAVRLAQAVAGQRGATDVTFAVADFLSGPLCLDVEGAEVGWDLVLDKGTFDAMALAEKDAAGRRPCDAYPARVSAALKPGGFFLITSCNFTHEELLRTFTTPETELSYHSRIDHPSISFGGVKGSTYCSVAFQKTTEK
ncbi:S-adenosyl-L-methionine-dependent methyltransferase [Phellopilus nigrolimitatus]|nr:S-adenosyl-L-methionine-dependent methyltransferase [Phellopilus nigrolimitatus]